MSDLSENKKTDNIISSKIELDKIYPTPKSYDELARERDEINILHAKHIPKHVVLFTGIKIYSLLIGLALILILISFIIFTNTIGGVFFSFLLGLIWFGCVVWAMKSISDTFQKFGFSANPFFLLYGFSYPLMAFVLYKLTTHLPLIVSFMLITCLHFVLVYILVTTILRSTRDSS